MKNKYLVGALLCLLGQLPKKVHDQKMTMKIYCPECNDSITVNELVKRTIDLMEEGMKGKEESEP